MATTGWIIFIAALGMMAGLVGVDLVTMKSWSDITTPAFMGNELLHFAAVVTAFIGGKLIPESRDNKLTRSTDKKIEV